MKQKDIAIIIIVVVASGILAVLVSKLTIKSADKQQQAEIVLAITPDFPAPDKRFFNSTSIDPTLPIQIGDNTNTDPFKGDAVQ